MAPTGGCRGGFNRCTQPASRFVLASSSAHGGSSSLPTLPILWWLPKSPGRRSIQFDSPKCWGGRRHRLYREPSAPATVDRRDTLPKSDGIESRSRPAGPFQDRAAAATLAL